MRRIDLDMSIKFPLYRFTKRKWAEKFFETGQLRLGTIFDYAKDESYGDAIHDRHEGYQVYRVPKEKWVDGSPEIHFILARNNLLLCASTDYDEGHYDEFDADCCIRIDSPEFFAAIDIALRTDFTGLLLRKVTYYDKSRWDQTRDYVDFAGVMKDISFSHQNEVRALWEPKKQPINYMPFEFPAEYFNNLENPLLDVSEDKWFQERIAKECEWLKPKIIFVPKAIKYCTLIQRSKA